MNASRLLNTEGSPAFSGYSLTSPSMRVYESKSSSKKRTAEEIWPFKDLHESIDSPDDVVAVHAIKFFAKEACHAEQALGFLHEIHPDMAF